MKIEKIYTCTGHRAALYALAPGRDERHFLSAGGDGWIVEWDIDHPETGKLIASVESQVFSLFNFPGRGRLIAGNMNGGVHWIDTVVSDRTRNIQHHRKGVYDIIGTAGRVFTTGGDGTLSRWDPETGKSEESFQLSSQALRCMAYSEKRREIAVGGSDNSIYFVDSETLVLKKTLANAHNNSVFSVSFSPDNRYLLSGGRDAILRIWDLEDDFRQVSEQTAHLFTINHIIFSPDGQFYATASRDKTIKIWDAGNFHLLKVIDTIRYGAHINSVNRLLWLPDLLVSCGDDRSVMLWRVIS